MKSKNIILIAIVVLVAALIAFGAFVYINDNNSMPDILNATDNATNIIKNTTNVTNKTTNITKTNNTNATNKTLNETHKIYNPQTDSYVEVVGEAYDKEVNRWYTYDSQNVRYYNTRIWTS